jgi:hypothetical protein
MVGGVKTGHRQCYSYIRQLEYNFDWLLHIWKEGPCCGARETAGSVCRVQGTGDEDDSTEAEIAYWSAG